MALKSLHSLNCPNCMAALEHQGYGKMVCPFCGSSFIDEALAAQQDEAPAETPKKKKSKEKRRQERARSLEEILKDYIERDFDESAYGCVITLDGETVAKHSKARPNFNIGGNDVIYMVWDETMFGSCKEGYAITDQGFYLCYRAIGGAKFIDWQSFAGATIKKVDTCDLKINGMKMSLTGSNGRDMTDQLLCDIQDALIDELGY